MLYFKTRAQARNFAKGTKKKVIDLAKGSPRDLFKVQSGFSKQLQDEFEFQTSDSNIAEMLIANEYEFAEDGENI